MLESTSFDEWRFVFPAVKIEVHHSSRGTTGRRVRDYGMVWVDEWKVRR